MLSIQKCRDLLGDETLTDKQIIDVRDSFFYITEQVLDYYFEKTKEGNFEEKYETEPRKL